MRRRCLKWAIFFSPLWLSIAVAFASLNYKVHLLILISKTSDSFDVHFSPLTAHPLETEVSKKKFHRCRRSKSVEKIVHQSYSSNGDIDQFLYAVCPRNVLFFFFYYFFFSFFLFLSFFHSNNFPTTEKSRVIFFFLYFIRYYKSKMLREFFLIIFFNVPIRFLETVHMTLVNVKIIYKY